MSKRIVDVTDRYVVGGPDVLADALGAAGVRLVRTERTAYASARIHGAVYVAESVPGNALDILICDSAPPWEDIAWVLEIGRKTGKYSGNDRWRFTVRQYPARCREVSAAGAIETIKARSDSDGLMIRVGLWAGTFRVLRCDLDTARLDRVVRWHASRYFKHLVDDEVVSAAGLFEAEVLARMALGEQVGLAEANRLAERVLYRASRDAGWRKLTLRERAALGLVGGQWWPVDRIDAARGAESPTGCGEATLAAASGSVIATVQTWR